MRKPESQPEPIPVSIPLVVLDVREDGTVAVDVDGKPLDPDSGAGMWLLCSFGQIIDPRHQRLDVGPARVEVREADRTAFTDCIATRRRRPPAHTLQRNGNNCRASSTPSPATDSFPVKTSRSPSSPGTPTPPAPAPTAPSSTPPDSGQVLPAGSWNLCWSAVSPALRSSGWPPLWVSQGQAGRPRSGDEPDQQRLRSGGWCCSMPLSCCAVPDQVAAFLTGIGQPAGGPRLRRRRTRQSRRPRHGARRARTQARCSPGASLGCTPSVLVTGELWVWSRLRRHTHRVEQDPRRTSRHRPFQREVVAAACEKVYLRRAEEPAAPAWMVPRPRDVQLPASVSRARACGGGLDRVLIEHPLRQGLHLVIPAILDAPGAVVVTSTRPDNLTATMRARRRVGPVAIFDPQHPRRGPAADAVVLIRGFASRADRDDPRHRALAASSQGGVGSGGVLGGKTKALQSLLHAAAIDHRPPAELFRWTLDPTTAADAVAILTGSTQAPRPDGPSRWRR